MDLIFAWVLISQQFLLLMFAGAGSTLPEYVSWQLEDSWLAKPGSGGWYVGNTLFTSQGHLVILLEFCKFMKQKCVISYEN